MSVEAKNFSITDPSFVSGFSSVISPSYVNADHGWPATSFYYNPNSTSGKSVEYVTTNQAPPSLTSVQQLQQPVNDFTATVTSTRLNDNRLLMNHRLLYMKKMSGLASCSSDEAMPSSSASSYEYISKEHRAALDSFASVVPVGGASKTVGQGIREPFQSTVVSNKSSKSMPWYAAAASREEPQATCIMAMPCFKENNSVMPAFIMAKPIVETGSMSITTFGDEAYNKNALSWPSRQVAITSYSSDCHQNLASNSSSSNCCSSISTTVGGGISQTTNLAHADIVAVATLAGYQKEVGVTLDGFRADNGSFLQSRLNLFSPVSSSSDDNSSDSFKHMPVQDANRTTTIHNLTSSVNNVNTGKNFEFGSNKVCGKLKDSSLPGLEWNSVNNSIKINDSRNLQTENQLTSSSSENVDNAGSSSCQLQSVTNGEPLPDASQLNTEGWLPSFGVFASPNRRPSANSALFQNSENVLNQDGLSDDDSSNSSNGSIDSVWPTQSTLASTSVSTSLLHQQSDNSLQTDIGLMSREVFCCHICSFVGTTSETFKMHMGTHFEHRCPNCDYTSRTEGRLKKHIKDFHCADSSNMRRESGRPKIMRCRQCDFIAQTKLEFWQHARTHIKMDRVLQCPRCPFVTEYKHHLEYHLRNHFGSKPFQCPKCNYACVNKSMLNSHMKSHTNVYQYRCSECSYATKYCHSLKLHLQKYGHQPAVVLNPDGSLPIDGSGDFELVARRGPAKRTAKTKRRSSSSYRSNTRPSAPSSPEVSNDLSAMTANTPKSSSLQDASSYSTSIVKNNWDNVDTTQMPPLLPVFPGLSKADDPATDIGAAWPQAKFTTREKQPWLPSCSFCHEKFHDHQQLLRHIVRMHAAENRDILAMIGISPESLLETTDSTPVLQQSPQINTSSQKQALDSGATSELFEFDLNPPTIPHTLPKKITPGLIKSAPELRTITRVSHSGSDGELTTGLNKSASDPSRPRSLPAVMLQDEESSKVFPYSVRDTGRGGDKPLDLTKRVEATELFPVYLIANNTDSRPVDTKEGTIGLDRNDPNNMSHILGQPANFLNDEHVQSMEGIVEHDVMEKRNTHSGSSTPTHKRSRKGKAYKLDMLRIQVGCGSESPSGSDTSSMDIMPVQSACIQMQQLSHSLSIKHDIIESSLYSASDGFSNKMQFATEGTESEDLAIVISQPEEPVEAHRSQLQQSTVSSDLLNIERRINLDSTANDWRINLSESSQIDQNHRRYSSSVSNDNNTNFECQHCQIIFRDYIMYMMHKGYHGYQHPFTCNMCGFCANDRIEFFLHIARVAHE